MKQATCRLWLILAGVLGLAIGKADADDLSIPCWRNLAGTTNHSTYQNWDFNTDDNPASPDAKFNPGNPVANVQTGFLASGWFLSDPGLGTKSGMWDLGGFGSMELSIPETAGSTNGYRYVVVQATGYRDGATYQLGGVSVDGGSLVSSNRTAVETNGFGGVWEVEKTVWRLTNAPWSEQVLLAAGGSGALVDQVVVDTLTVDVPTPANLVLSTGPGQCGRSNVTWTVAAVDGCVISNVVSAPASGSVFPKGVTAVSSTIYDSLGGNKGFNFTVTVNDTELPVVTCPADLVVPKGAGLCGAVVTFTATATDNCDVTNIVSSPASGSTFPLGLTTVTSVAQDSSGNLSSPCTFTVRVVDVSGDLGAAPCWRGASNATYQHFAFSTNGNPDAPEWRTNQAGVASASTTVGFLGEGWLEADAFLGCRQGMWDLGGFGSMELSIPETAGSTNGYRYVVVQATGYRDGATYQLGGVSVDGGSLVSSNRTAVETNGFGGVWEVEKTVWRLTNAPWSEQVLLAAGGSGALVDQVVVDTLTVDVPTPANLVLSTGPGQCGRSNVTWTVAAVDGCVISNVVSAPASGSVFPKGVTAVSSTIYDSLGGNKGFNFTVTVNDTELPVVTCPADLVVPKGAGLCGAVVTFTATATDNCLVTNIVSSPPSGSTFPLGLTTVTSVAQDSSGNLSSPCTFTVRVVDVSGDLGAVPCWRGASNATYQHFAFSTNGNPDAPELRTNHAGVASASTTVGFLGEGWLEADALLGCRQGMWDLGGLGYMDLNIPETAGSTNGYRYVVVQATGYRDGATYQLAAVSVGDGSLVSSNRTAVETNGFGGIWEVEKTVWRLTNAPWSEQVLLAAGAFGALLDQVVVDTLTVDYPNLPDITTTADIGLCGKTNVTWSLAALDGCVLTNLVSSPPSGSDFPVGTVPVTNHITDAFGGIRTCVFYVTVNDTQPPVIGSLAATEVQPGSGTVDVKNCNNPTLQGIINISIQASNNCPLAGGHPLVVLSNDVAGATAVFVSESPTNTFNYTWTVGPSTLPGSWTATVGAADSGATTITNFTLCVDVSQITGLVQLQDFVGASRAVTFVTTGGLSNRIWTLPLNFSGSVASYALYGIPGGTTGLSAKTAWSLRRKLPATLDVNGQAAINFTGVSQLRGGDLNADNTVGGDDYDVFSLYWQSANPTADLNGDGTVNGDDYNIFSSNWQTTGDPQ